MKVFSFKIRAAQLDLARQMETIDFIKRFIDFLAAHGYNTLTLYLEGRISTASFPFPPAAESYTPEQMKEIVRYAGNKGLDVIPAIPALGHADLFLKYPELENLAETRGEFKGRFGSGFKHVFCPSQEETCQFLEKYYSEISEIFTSPYLHAGCDESWDIGCCDLCRKRLQKNETQSDIFAKHLIELHRIITGKLGKRMIIWDDMFEYYPEALPLLPRDIVMACWQYQPDVEKTKGHFANHVIIDTLAKYDSLGFDYLIGPSERTIYSSKSFTAYGAKHKPLGGMMLTWEKSRSFILKSMPIIAWVGKFWESGVTGDIDVALKAAVADVFGINDKIFTQAIKSICCEGLYADRYTRTDYAFTRRETDFDYGRIRLVETLLEILPAYMDKVDKSSRDILEEIILILRLEQINFELIELLPEFFKNDADIPELTEKSQEIASRLKNAGENYLAMWHRLRPGIDSRKMSDLYDNYLESINEVPELAAKNGFLKVHFMLPDQFSAQTVRIFIKYDGNSSWEKLAEGSFKELMSYACFYSRMFLIPKDKIPVGLKIETWGFGGQGFTYFEAENRQGGFIPSEVCNIVGNVTDPENILCRDWQWTFAGERNTMKAFRDSSIANAIHGFEIKLKKEK